MLSKRKLDLQKEDNDIVVQYYEHLPNLGHEDVRNISRLYSCNATMHFTDGCVLLRSYNTFVAAFDIDKSIVYDFSRYVYKYTPTTAQHVRKFAQYLKALHTITYKEVR